ncbi:MAG: 50S ribosomal protein L11 methyltransferase, partial [Deltaproteobacteria bacterium]|nr:50S ribosomal protein L11 methyltransferase [Deltaproteobacteria bacterium]
AAFDLVAANITHDILARNAEILGRCVNQGGFLVLSGILKGEQEKSMEKIFGRLGLQPVKRLARDEWAALLLQKL